MDIATAGTGAATFEFLLNGRTVRVCGPGTQTTLLDYIRSQGFTGAKEGCAEGECGACAVLLLKADGAGNRYVAVNSCLMFLPAAAGQEVYTVEALAERGALTDVQREIAERGGSQCGYCTPGFVVSLFAEQMRPGRENGCDANALSGNLCRCTGYRPIRDAVEALGPAPEGIWRERMNRAPVTPGAVDYVGDGGEYLRPESLSEALAALQEGATAIAGGTDLGVESSLKSKRYSKLVDISELAELKGFRDSENEVEIGAALPLSALGRSWTGAPDVVREWLDLFASPLLRNRATLGGNFGTASPIGDASPLFLALDAELELASPVGRRRVPLRSFFRSFRKTDKQRGELIVSVHVPKPLPERAAFFKAAKRRCDDISTVAAALALERDDSGRITAARFAYGGVAVTPVRVFAAEEAVLGLRCDRGSLERAQLGVAAALKPISDHRGSAAYRLAVAQSLLEKFWVGMMA